MKVALTGGATGIGLQSAKILADQGDDITIFDISEPPLETCQWIKTDLSDPHSITAAIGAAKGPFDALINNAGLPPKQNQSALVLNVNFIGFRQFMHAMLDKLAPGASIVSTASRAGAKWRDNIDQIKSLMTIKAPDALDAFITSENIDYVRAYNLSKEAIIVMTIIEVEKMLKRGFRINCVSPAAVSTDILDDFVSAFGERVARNIERVGRAGHPEEVAKVIAFLAGPESHWINGCDIPIDGGMGALALADMLQIPKSEM